MKKLSDCLSKFISPEIRSMQVYKVADSRGLLKLDAMESPYQWPESLKQKWLVQLQQAEINRYPDPQASGIKQRLRTKYQLDETLDILLGNGSDELIQLIIMAVLASGKPIMAPAPSFVMYQILAQSMGLPFVPVSLKENFELDVDAFLKAIHEYQPAVIFLATPNNPTGNVFSDQAIESIIQATPGIVVLDEAYTAFTQSDQLHWLEKYDHVLIMRTFSKVGLAGLRLGFAIGHQALINELNKLRLPYNINVLTQISIHFALDHFEVLEQQSQQICEQRALLFNQLQSIGSFECVASEANFITVRCLNNDAAEVFEKLKQAGVLIKCLHGAHPLLEQCLRITVSTLHENAILLKALSNIVN